MISHIFGEFFFPVQKMEGRIKTVEALQERRAGPDGIDCSHHYSGS